MTATLLVALSLVIVGLSAGGAAGQAQTPSPPPIVDYANYPLNLGLIPPGCTAQGPDAVIGELFSANGGTPVPDMRQLGTVPAGAVITMTWTGFAPGCEGIGITLSRKIARAVTFDANTNQYLNIWSYCGPGGNPCTAPFTLVLDTSRSLPVACYQLDANLGPPLNDVGPLGAFYSQGQSFNMLISANNGGTAPCDVPPCPENPDLPAASAQCVGQTTTTTAAPSVTTTTVPPTTPPPSTQPTSQPSCPPEQVLDAQTGRCVAQLAAGELPFTGSRTRSLGRTGLLLLSGGAVLALVGRRWRRTPLHRS